MFKAINCQTGQYVVILDQTLSVEELRTLDKQDMLVCQECKQPVLVRAGEIRRWHFAHKQVENCTYKDESPELLNARAVLYEWLGFRHREKVSKVTIENKLDDPRAPRPIDCWVEYNGKQFAYWIVRERLSTEKRWELKALFKELGVEINWIFLTQKLKRDKEHPNRILLTLAERELMQHSEKYDGSVLLGGGKGDTLHYLDAENKILTTFRGLCCINHQVFLGHEESHELSSILTSPKNGEFVHPGERERWEKWENKNSCLAEQRKECLKNSYPNFGDWIKQYSAK